MAFLFAVALFHISLVNIILILVRISILQKKNSVFGHARNRTAANGVIPIFG